METANLGGGGRRVVVIGGGVAGSLIAKSLQFIGDLILVDPKEYFEIPYANARSMVEPSFAERSVINHKDYITNGRVVTSHAIDVTSKEVLTAEGCLIAYDYLVIATGHDYPLPKSRTERLNQRREENQRITSANSVLIIGGGPVGVELAGEIAVDYPEKKVTLAHEGHRLLEFIGPKAADKALDWFRSKNVDVKLGRPIDLRIIYDGSKSFRTSSGEILEADYHFLCTGSPVATEWLKETILKDNLDKNGRLKVDEFLRVKGHKNIFAIGDITDIREIKQGRFAQKHALVAAKNLRLLMTGGKESKMESYEPHPSKTIVSLGRKDAVAQFRYTTVIGSVPGMIKSRDLFVGKVRKKLGLESHFVHV